VISALRSRKALKKSRFSQGKGRVSIRWAICQRGYIGVIDENRPARRAFAAGAFAAQKRLINRQWLGGAAL